MNATTQAMESAATGVGNTMRRAMLERAASIRESARSLDHGQYGDVMRHLDRLQTELDVMVQRMDAADSSMAAIRAIMSTRISIASYCDNAAAELSLSGRCIKSERLQCEARLRMLTYMLGQVKCQRKDSLRKLREVLMTKVGFIDKKLDEIQGVEIKCMHAASAGAQFELPADCIPEVVRLVNKIKDEEEDNEHQWHVKHVEDDVIGCLYAAYALYTAKVAAMSQEEATLTTRYRDIEMYALSNCDTIGLNSVSHMVASRERESSPDAAPSDDSLAHLERKSQSPAAKMSQTVTDMSVEATTTAVAADDATVMQ